MQPPEDTTFDDILGDEEQPEETFEEEETPQEQPEEEETPRFRSIEDMLTPPEDEEEETPPPPPPPKPQEEERPPKNVDELRQQIKKEFVSRLASQDPGEAALWLLEKGEKLMEERIEQRLASTQGDRFQTAVEAFKRRVKEEDPKLFSACEKDFDKLLNPVRQTIAANPAALNTVNRQQLDQGLEQFYERANGLALRRMRKATKEVMETPEERTPRTPERQTPPQYNPPPPAKRTAPKKPIVVKTAADKETVRLAKIAGLSEDDLRDILGQ
jgi:hypothetical protein